MKNMKFFLFCILSVCYTITIAQSFEGYMKWVINMEISPEKKQSHNVEPEKIAAAQKEMEDKMNDPEFKKMLEQNPSLKAQMEQSMAMMKQMASSEKNGGGIEGMFPKSMTVKIKDGNSLVTMEGGMSAMLGDMLFIKSKDISYSIKRDQKTYSVLPKSVSKDEKKVPTVTKTTETQKILNYTCTKYIIEWTEGKSNLIQNVWATTEIDGFEPDFMSKISLGSKPHASLYKTIKGVPLKIQQSMKEGSMEMSVVEFKKISLPASDFTIPIGFTETKSFSK